MWMILSLSVESNKYQLHVDLNIDRHKTKEQYVNNIKNKDGRNYISAIESGPWEMYGGHNTAIFQKSSQHKSWAITIYLRDWHTFWGPWQCKKNNLLYFSSCQPKRIFKDKKLAYSDGPFRSGRLESEVANLPLFTTRSYKTPFTLHNFHSSY